MVQFVKRLFGAKPKTQAEPVAAPKVDFEKIDLEALMGRSSEDMIDRFLQKKDLRIVVDERQEVDAEVVIEPNFDSQDDIVSEDLAKIYLSQGLNEEAIEIYRKLSLLNSEKSVYFAKLIALIKNNNLK